MLLSIEIQFWSTVGLNNSASNMILESKPKLVSSQVTRNSRLQFFPLNILYQYIDFPAKYTTSSEWMHSQEMIII